MSAFLFVLAQAILSVRSIFNTIDASTKTTSHRTRETVVGVLHVFLPRICSVQGHSPMRKVLQLAKHRVVVNLFLMALYVCLSTRGFPFTVSVVAFAAVVGTGVGYLSVDGKRIDINRKIIQTFNMDKQLYLSCDSLLQKPPCPLPNWRFRKSQRHDEP
jgi:hypothetical protein